MSTISTFPKDYAQVLVPSFACVIRSWYIPRTRLKNLQGVTAQVHNPSEGSTEQGDDTMEVYLYRMPKTF